MREQRLGWLIGVMAVLVVLRVLVPPTSRETALTVVEPIVRTPIHTTFGRPIVAMPLPASSATASPFPDAPDEDGNAFPVRPPQRARYEPPVPKIVVVKAAPDPVIAPVVNEPLPPPMPYTVIGTWDDGREPGVFLAGPYGTLLARVGTTLQTEYQVSAITTQQISLRHLESKKEIRLDIPRPPQTSFSVPPSTSR